MKRNQLIYTMSIVLGGWLFLAHTSGAGSVQNADRTGGPVASGTCSNCHGGGSFGSTVDIAVTNESGDTVTAYLPETAYTLRVKISAEGAAAYGFQTVALDASNAGAGAFGTAPAGTQITTIDDRAYFEHSERSSSGEWEIEWTSPADGAGKVGFYVAGNSVNNANGNQGDEISLDSFVIEQEVLSSQRDLANFGLEVGPNPASHFVRATWDNRQVAPSDIRVVGMNGQEMQRQVVNRGDSESTIDLLDIPAGMYVLQLTAEEGAQSRTFLKQ